MLILAAFALVTCFVGIQSGPALGDHECINALAARNVVETGNWLIPHISEIPRIRKPPLGIWLIAAASYIVDGPSVSPPVSDYAARLPSAIAAWGTVMLVYWLGRLMYGLSNRSDHRFYRCRVRRYTCLRTQRSSRHGSYFFHYPIFCLLLAWGFTSEPEPLVYRRVLYILRPGDDGQSTSSAGYGRFSTRSILVCCDSGFHDFGETATRAPNTILLTLLASTKSQLKQLHSLWLIPGICLFLLIAGVWPVLVYINFPGALDLWRAEYLDRFTGDMSDRSQPLLYYLPILFGMTAPFLLSLPEALAAPFF